MPELTDEQTAEQVEAAMIAAVEESREAEQDEQEEPDVEPEAKDEAPPEPEETIEDEARAMGWCPKEEWQGKPKDWRDAQAFVDRKGVMGINTRLKETVKTLTEDNKRIAQHYEKLLAKERADHLADMRQKYRTAIDEGAEDEVIAKLEDEIDEAVIAAKAPAAQPEPEGKPSELYEAWHEKNDWYQKDKAMTAVANAIAEGIPQDTPEAEVYKIIDAKMREEMPHKFAPKQNPRRMTGSSVESGKPSDRQSKGGLTKADLTDEERRTMAAFVRSGLITEADYIKGLER